MKPAQAAEMSNAAEPGRAPSFCCTVTATAGIGMSGLMVPTMMQSIWLGSISAVSQARRPASAARSDVERPSSRMRRAPMPVRSRIHESEVSTSFERSSLVNTLSGTALPVPAMRALNMRSILGSNDSAKTWSL